MAFSRILPEETGPIEGVIDTSIVAIAHFDNPAKKSAIPTDLTIDAVTYASGYHIESWDGYIIALSRLFNAPIIYSIDKELMRMVKEIKVINPVPEEEFKKYNEWLKRLAYE